MKKDAKKMSVDDAKDRKGKLGMKDDEFETIIKEKQDEFFTDLRSLIFSWKEQPDGSKKIMSRLPNGKIVFLDRSDSPEEIKIDTPYICAVYEREREAFAKVICEEYEPKIYVLSSDAVSMVWKDEKGDTRRKMPGGYNSFEERMMYAVKFFRTKGFPEVKIVFRENIRREII